MQIVDRVYGQVDITEPVLCDLINSSTLQRLQGVDQAGYFEPYFPGSAHSRFEHSLGVCILLRKFGASVEEQIAGLIHDVSHSAFSHCIDYVLDAGSETKQDHQDSVFEVYVRASELPHILRGHGYDIERILDDTNFPLKETLLPDLCADRIDYSLRSAMVYGVLASPQDIVADLTTHANKWVFRHYEVAREYTNLFHVISTRYFAGLASARMFRTVADYLRYAHSKGYIEEKDLYTTDEAVLSRIGIHHEYDIHLHTLFERMNMVYMPITNDQALVNVCCKSRLVDPLCLIEGVPTRVSTIDTVYRETLARGLKPVCHQFR